MGIYTIYYKVFIMFSLKLIRSWRSYMDVNVSVISHTWFVNLLGVYKMFQGVHKKY